MSLERVISGEHVQQNLRNLPIHMPDQEQIIYDFCAFLADRLQPELVPQGFVNATELALYDAEQGKDGFTGKTISKRLSGYPPQMYRILRMYIPQIAEVVCPKDFSQDVKDIYEKLYAKMQK